MRKMHPFHRTELITGGEGFDRLTNARVVVVGLGGVGSYAAEAMARSGVGHLRLVDHDVVCVTNVNRQLHATRKTVGKSKAELMGERCLAINPKAEVEALGKFYDENTDAQILADEPDIVFDCIDNMTAKIKLLVSCHQRGIRVISAMGAGGRMDPTRVRVSDLSETRIDPFAKIVRDILRKEHGIETGIECVWTDEPPNDLDAAAQSAFRCICVLKDPRHSCDQRLQVQGSVAWMPSIFGLTMAGTAVHRLLDRKLKSDIKPKPRLKAAQGKLSAARKKELLQAAREATS